VNDLVYPYDRELYGRLFLNCYQRQALVMLAEERATLHHLLRRCLVSTDHITDQIVRRQRPKYDFDSDVLGREDLLRIGLVESDVPFDTYAAARPPLLEAVQRAGYAFLVVDVFYLPHCPEYRSAHVVHTIVLKEYVAGTREWTVVDDNPASVLCTYTYPEHVVAAAYDNNTVRRLRFFSSVEFAEDEMAADSVATFRELLENHQDSYSLFADIDDVLACPWVAPDRMIAALHDAFSIYRGSRICLREYVTRAIGDPAAESALQRIVQNAGEVQNRLLLGKVTGMVDVGGMTSLCAGLRTAEEELVDLLGRAVARR
jgi:hypothetical protein